ncbi:glycosyltransferase family 25 protein [Stenotrophomonas sp. PS02298]|uniref:glycosyltransferase family 25 protein n=1 Tax=Stenotrophomonas sp. PS02298 TaxID=2991424 RepID=UPI002499EF13|nr:glycosyltransferase family 25 protein [Stenotrophomonas sp. PS02298]
MKVYLISLAEDQHRREQMRKRFACSYEDFEHIEGIRLTNRNVLSQIYDIRNFDDNLTTPELGCAISHTKALEAFLASGAPYALILEDDAIGDDSDIAAIANAIKQLPSDTFLLCGGQEGLRGQIYNYGRSTQIASVYQIPSIAKKFFTRACCYCVTRPSAQRILTSQRKSLHLSDNWGRYFHAWTSFYYIKRIAHPLDLSDSNIERERARSAPATELSRIYQDGIVTILHRLFSKILLRTLHRKLGLTRIE